MLFSDMDGSPIISINMPFRHPKQDFDVSPDSFGAYCAMRHGWGKGIAGGYPRGVLRLPDMPVCMFCEYYLGSYTGFRPCEDCVREGVPENADPPNVEPAVLKKMKDDAAAEAKAARKRQVKYEANKKAGMFDNTDCKVACRQPARTITAKPPTTIDAWPDHTKWSPKPWTGSIEMQPTNMVRLVDGNGVAQWFPKNHPTVRDAWPEMFDVKSYELVYDEVVQELLEEVSDVHSGE